MTRLPAFLPARPPRFPSGGFRRFPCAAPILLVGVLLAAPFQAAAQPLPVVVERALRANPEVSASANRRFATDEELSQARAAYLPRVDLNAAIGRQRLDSPTTRVLRLDEVLGTRRIGGVSVTQPIFDGFATRSEVERQRARVQGAAQRVAATSDDIASRAIGAYLEVLRRREGVLIATENLDAHRRLRETIRTRAESGVGRRADLDQAEGRLSLAESNLAQERTALRDAEALFLRVTGAAPGVLIRPAPVPLPASEDAAREQARRANPAILAVRADVEAARAQAEGALAARWPRLDLEVARNHDRLSTLGPTDDTSALLRLRYNLFRGGADESRVRQTRYLADEARDLALRAERLVDESIAAAWADLTLGRERNAALRQYVAASAITREAYAAQFSIGQRTLLDLLNAENEHFNARLTALAGELVEIDAAYRLHAAIGSLPEVLGVARPAAASAP